MDIHKTFLLVIMMFAPADKSQNLNLIFAAGTTPIEKRLVFDVSVLKLMLLAKKSTPKP
ncbi:MAG: hypothetical protein R2801_01020 [Chitinophagales bacterium]